MTDSNNVSPALAGVEVHGMTRGDFILRGALTAGATLGLGAVTPFVSSAMAAGASSDIDILNFALTLEYLETNFYQVKAKSVGLSGAAKSYATEFGDQEAQHVTALTAAIKAAGGTPVAMPTFAFPVTDEASFLSLAYTVENLGVSAYNGAGPLIKNKEYLAAGGEIVQVEARHAAVIGLLINKSPVPNGGFDKPATKTQVLAAAGPLIK